MSGYDEGQDVGPGAALATLPDTEDELEKAREAAEKRLPIPRGNGLLAPERWQMFGRIANTVSNTEFVPKGLRGKAPAVMACLLYGDAQGLHPSVALTEIHIVDGKPTMSATLMVGKIRMAGHKLSRKELRDEQHNFIGCTAIGVRGDDGEVDEFTFTMEMAARAGLLSKNNWQNYPEAMCWARCVSQLARMLFPDVFLGQSAYTSEELGLEETDESGAALPEDAMAADRVPEQPGNGDDQEPGGGDAGQDQEATELAGQEPTVPQEEPLEGEVVDEQPPLVRVLLGEEDRGAYSKEALEEYLTTSGLEQIGYEVDTETGQKTVHVRELDVGAQATLDAAAAIVKESMPPVMAAVTNAVERGDRPFVQAVLDHEKAKGDKQRKRLVDGIEGMLETMPAEPGSDPEPQPAAAFEPTAEPQGDTSIEGGNKEAKIVRQKAACAWLEDQMPSLRNWRLEAVVGSASRQWNVTVHALEDLEEWQLDAIWEAVPDEAKKALALVPADKLVKLAGVEEAE